MMRGPAGARLAAKAGGEAQKPKEEPKMMGGDDNVPLCTRGEF